MNERGQQIRMVHNWDFSSWQSVITTLLALFLVAFVELAGVEAESIWLEGESPAQSNFVRQGWYDGVNKDVMSGHAWLSHYSRDKEGEARYDFTVTSAGNFVFWLRCNPLLVTMDWKLDRGDWHQVDFADTRESIMISERPDHRSLGWVKVGTIELTAGRHSLAFRLRSQIAHHGGIDCLVVTSDPFTPTGATKPGDRAATGPDKWFPFVPNDDPFSPQSVIDMSGLIDKPAGKHGFLQARGEHLQFEHASSPVKFWAVNANYDSSLSRPQALQRVRYLAKHGINMVRQHTVADALGPLRDGQFDAARIDGFDRWFADLKNQGIYSTWSVFYPLWIGAGDGYDPELFAELPRQGGGDSERGRRSTSGVVNFMRPLQDLELAYVAALLRRRNPYTGLAYKDDPALAVVEVHNEDCVFFHAPLNQLAVGKEMPKHSQVVRQMFCAWAKRRYKTDAALQAAWGTTESLASGELRLFGAWEFQGGKPDQRMGDFIRFLTDVQRGYFARRESELRDIGYRAVTVTTAWQAGGPAADAANLYCDAAMDMIDRHNYFGGGAGRHSIRPGQVNNGSHLAQPGGGILSSGLYQVRDKPFCMTEWTQSPPNQWKAEIAPLIAFYGLGLQGWDASYHFIQDGPRLRDGYPGESSYASDTPAYMGQFPALAFAVHMGHIDQGPLVADRRISVDDCFTGLDPLNQDFTGGSNRDHKALRNPRDSLQQILAVGRVTVAFDGSPNKPALDTDQLAGASASPGVVRSATGQLAWDANARIVVVQSPKTQAVIGFAGGTSHTLPGVDVAVKTPFVSLIFTPLDDQPLEQSQHILITALARDMQTGTQYNDDGELISVGSPPLLLEPVQATITLKGKPPQQVTPLDIYGVPIDHRVPVNQGAFAIDGTYQAIYYEVRR